MLHSVNNAVFFEYGHESVIVQCFTAAVNVAKTCAVHVTSTTSTTDNYSRYTRTINEKDIHRIQLCSRSISYM